MPRDDIFTWRLPSIGRLPIADIIYLRRDATFDSAIDELMSPELWR